MFAKFLESLTTVGLYGGSKKNKRKGEETLLITQPDEIVVFRQLKGRAGVNEFDITEELSGEAELGTGGSAGGMGGHSDGDFFGEIKKDIDAKVY